MMNLETFDDEYMRKREYIAWRAPIVVSSIIETMGWSQAFPHTERKICDVGCSIGEFVAEFIKRGYDCVGIDGSESAYKHFLVRCLDANHFLKYNFTTNKPYLVRDFINEVLFEYYQFDLVLCLEVFPVIKHDYWEILLDLICSTLNAKTILISIAKEKEKDLSKRMRSRGYGININKNHTLRTLLHGWKHKPAIKSLYHSSTFWEKP